MSIIKSIGQTEGKYLVEDFRTFMEFLFNENAYLTKKSQHISPKFLYPINKRMTYPADNVTPKSKQPTYFQLHLFQQLADAAMLYKRGSGPNGNFSMIPTDRYTEFLSLTETEQYFTLLEILWVKVDWNKLVDGTPRLVMTNLKSTFLSIRKIKSDEKMYVSREQEYNPIAQSVQLLNNFSVYFSYFGFWKIERDWGPETNYPLKGEYMPKSITVNEFGKKMMKVLGNKLPILEWNQKNALGGKLSVDTVLSTLEDMQKSGRIRIPNVEEHQPQLEHDELFIEPFVPLFSKGELQKTLSIAEKTSKEGVYTFKVTFHRGVCRKIELDSSHTLGDLHMAIQGAFDFDNDHLYAFYMDGKKFSRESIHCEEAHEAEIGDLDLIEGQEFLYLFDFGAEWTFKVKLEQIDTQKSEPEEFPILIEGKGGSPEQY